ncbi:LuxR family transcriptional regulator [Cytophagales bacterium WSM2-2]|nr:LuxR family transcriptional regulator [Cytophagales bacterium WSM2-2]
MHSELVERSNYLEHLESIYKKVEEGVAHTAFLTGEAGIGKTSLVNHFLDRVKRNSVIYTGACDALYTPRPLGPVYDIAPQIGPDFLTVLRNENDRALIFATFIQKISSSTKPVVLVFEDIHWADEATIDLIKFMARRITRLKCMFILTYRDNELSSQHPFKNIFGDLPPGSFSKIKIKPFSPEAVDELAKARGHESGEKVYSLTGGNPFYVTEILSDYSSGIPERVKDSVLATYFKKDERTQQLWQLLSILPTRIDLKLLKYIEPNYPNTMEKCIHGGIIVVTKDYMGFKHELFRIAIEESLTNYKRMELHKRIVKIMLDNLGEYKNLSRLVHHARLADDEKTVVAYAPKAAREAASVGSHLEASKLYLTAICHAKPEDPELVTLYEKHAYECYLTSQFDMAIHSQEQALAIWRNRRVRLKEGDATRFLSRLWWFKGDHEKYMSLALEAITILDNGFPTRERALAYSNMSQLCMLADRSEDGLHWGNKAIDLTTRMEDMEILSHALNNIGTIKMRCINSQKEGEELLNKSLLMAHEHGYHEHVARAYTNFGANYVIIRKYKKAEEAFDLGLKYCELRDLTSWINYMSSWKSRMLLETGRWKEAEVLAEQLQLHTNQPEAGIVRVGALISLAKIKIRRGDFAEAKPILAEAKKIVMPTREPQRIIAVLATELELHWLTREPYSTTDIEFAIRELFPDKNECWQYSELTYWLNKNKLSGYVDNNVRYIGPHEFEMKSDYLHAAEAWKELGCPYEQALALMNGNAENQKQALLLLDELGATAVRDMLRLQLKTNGVKKIPRGPRESTRINPAYLTQRQVHVLQLLEDGLHNSEIADKLFISPKTVDHHISAILSKLEVNSRTKAVLEAKKLGVLK